MFQDKGVSPVDQQTVVSRLSDHLSVLVTSVRHANDDWEAWIPEGQRITLEGTRPRFMYDRTLHYLELHFGWSGPERIVEQNDLKYVLLECPEFDIGVRNKKLDEHFFSCNYPTDQQLEIRQH